MQKSFRKSASIKLAVLALLLPIAALLFFVPSLDRSVDTGHAWGKSGNYIVSYGPIMEPHSSLTKINYYLYSPSGDRIAHEKGPGSWIPVPLPTRGGSYLFFADKIRQAGGKRSEASIPPRSDIVFFDESPSLQFSVAVLNTSQSAVFTHSAMLFDDKGNIFEQDFPTVPSSLAVGDSEALISGRGNYGEKIVAGAQIYLLEPNGNLTRLPLPHGYETKEPREFLYPYVSYLGDGRYELTQGHSEPDATYATAFEVTLDKEKKELEVQSTRSITLQRHKDAAIYWMLPYGECGVIDKFGNVFINERNTEDLVPMGHIEGFSTDGEHFSERSFVRVHNPIEEPKFGVRRGGKIEIRKWKDPEKVILTLNEERLACWSADCGISHIAQI